ncbi:MAG: hypothetical protein ACTIOO_01410 [Pseudolactococcus laudensis]
MTSLDDGIQGCEVFALLIITLENVITVLAGILSSRYPIAPATTVEFISISLILKVCITCPEPLVEDRFIVGTLKPQGSPCHCKIKDPLAGFVALQSNSRVTVSLILKP